MLDALKAANVALRFLLELGILGAYGYWGYRTGRNTLIRIVLAVGLPVLAAAIWVIFGAPGAALQLKDPLHLALEVSLFGGAALALYVARQPKIAVTLAVLFVINRSLLYIWNQ